MKLTHDFAKTLELIVCGTDDLMDWISEATQGQSKAIEAKIEFLQTLLDLLQVSCFCYPLSSFALNRNAGFLLAELSRRDRPLFLRWATVTGDEHEAFESVYRHKLMPHCQEQSFDLANAATTYFWVGTGEPYISLELMDEVRLTTHYGFSVEDATDLFESLARDETDSFAKLTYAGFFQDSALRNRLRVSVWALLPSESLACKPH
jgi:hypothetical protein